MATLPAGLSTAASIGLLTQPLPPSRFIKTASSTARYTQAQHQAARTDMARRIRALLADTAWISLEESGFGFWARISLPALQAALDTWFAQHGDFALYIENRYALAIHAAEYEWEVLETQGRPLEAT